uniref:FYVE-type domain-containing protein n=1 Tax=Anopheles dirus TaxID=7168 RepID=A0A182N112_9DIPT
MWVLPPPDGPAEGQTMANPFDEPSPGGFLLAGGTASDTEILEGFLCPICKSDLRTPERLTVHVEHEHSEEQDLLKSLKEIFQGILSKGKKKGPSSQQQHQQQQHQQQADSGCGESGVAVGSAGAANNPLLQSAALQPVGCDCDHFGYFKAVRNPRLERYASETNKLIIRLDKLLDGCPAEPDQKKRHEQSKVPWIDGKLVKLCPSCAKGFGITRRQHHCRVCGSVMCDGCSLYLSFDDAYRIVQPNPVSPNDAMGHPQPRQQEQPNADVEANSFRVCEHCLHLLLNRMEMQDSRRDRPPITRLYDRLRQERADIEPHIPMYQRILDSLYEGDVIFRLSDASALRERIGRSAERLDSISKAILALAFATGSREEALKKALRLACIAYIKERMLAIPPLPVEDEIKRIQQRKRQETARRLERERLLALEAYERYELNQIASGGAGAGGDPTATGSSSTSSSSTASTAEMTVATMDNWSGTQRGPSATVVTSDPLLDQINIVRGYIRQAREAHRFEEVATLERNLAELTQEFYHRQRLDGGPEAGPPLQAGP